jgi:hypothetical protein
MPDVVWTFVFSSLSGVVAGAVAAFGTIRAISVHILYLRGSIEAHERRIERLEQK